MKLYEYESLIKPPKRFLKDLEIGDKFMFTNLSNGIAEKRWVYEVCCDISSRINRPLRDICEGCGSYTHMMSIEPKFLDEEVEIVKGSKFYFK
jgi:hypothetical protein